MKHLSRFDIEAIADKYVQAYMALPDVRNTQIYRIDPELLLEKVLGLNVEYQHLSYDGSILGMTSFTEMGVAENIIRMIQRRPDRKEKCLRRRTHPFSFAGRLLKLRQKR